MSQLKRIKISGYKSIEELDMKLTRLNVLIGPNGAGKSNFISFFKMLNEMVNNKLQAFVTRAGGAERLLHFGSKQTNCIRTKLSFENNTYEFELEPTHNNQFYFNKETISFHDERYDTPWKSNLGSGHRETLLYDDSRSKRGFAVSDQVIGALKSWRLYHFHDTGDTSRIKGDSDINDNKVLRSDASNLASFLYMLKNRHFEHYQNIVKTVQLIAPFLDDFILEPSALNEKSIRLEWRHKKYDDYFDISQLSDGTIRAICIATLLLQPSLPSTILLDEPELGLHPYAINVLSSLFKSVSMKTQLIVSTQSLLLMDQFDPEDVIVVDYHEDKSCFQRLSSEKLGDWLEDYTLGELWEKNILGGRPR